MKTQEQAKTTTRDMSEIRRRSAQAESDVYSLLTKSGFYFRRFRGFCDLIGRVGDFWVLIEVKISEDKAQRISLSPFNSRMTLKMARDLKGLVYIIIKLNGDYKYTRGERMMSFIAKRRTRMTTMRLGKWMDALRPIDELIKELQVIKEVGWEK